MSRTRKYVKRKYRSKKRCKSRKRIRSRTRVKRGGACRGEYVGSVPQVLSIIGARQPPFSVQYLNRRAPP